MSAEDELRALLKNAELLRNSSNSTLRDSGTSRYSSLASLTNSIASSLSIDSAASSAAPTNVQPPTFSIKQPVMRSGILKDSTHVRESSQSNHSVPPVPPEALSRTSAKGIKTYLPPGDCNDIIDYTVVKFSSELCFRGSIGSYLHANPMIVEQPQALNTTVSIGASIANASLNQTLKNPHGPITVYALGVSGQGIGEPLDCLTFVNIDKSKDQEFLRYGMTVAIRAPAAKERLLGVKDGKPGFYRNLVGQGEKWIILKGIPSGRGPEDLDSRGKYVRVGDLILLQAASSEQLLILHEGAQGSEAKFIHRDSAGVLGNELWQVELFHSQPNPLWMNRPYLSHQYLLQSPQARSTGSDAESRTFPGQSTTKQENSTVPLLNSFSFDEQQLILLRELLLVLSGVEGQYIRIKAAPIANSSSIPAPLSIAEASRKLQQISYTIDIDSANRSIASQIAHLFPICESAIHVREFLKLHSRYDFGLVSHAAVSAMKSIVREFDIVIAQLEHLLLSNKLTLQKVVYLLHPSKATFCGVLSPITTRLNNCSGGKLLDVLHGLLLEQGDIKARSVLLHVLNQASVPFLDLLSAWLFRGDLNDPYKEFMIQEDSSVSRDALQDDFNAQYWEHRYTLREKAVPKLLKDHANKALVAGKYLNVVRECIEELLKGSNPEASSSGSTLLLLNYQDRIHSAALPAGSEVSSPTASGGKVTTDGLASSAWMRDLHLPSPRKLVLDLNHSTSASSSLAEAINDAYTFSSQALLQLLQQAYHISEHLRSLRRFFLLENGDFFIQFMDTAEEELRRDVRDVTITRIQNLLHLAVQTSTLGTDLHREDLSCSLAPHNLIQHLHLIQSAGDMLPVPSSSASAMNIIQGASASFQASTSLISSVNEAQGLKGFEALTLEYKVGWPASIVLSKRAITKYQLLSRLLYFSKHVERRVLICWSDHQTSKRLDVRKALGKSYCLRHRMLHFLQNFVYYMTFEVIHPRSHEMEASMKNAKDLDELLIYHERFLDLCLKECLLASQDLLKVLTKIMTTCLLFADNIKRYADNVEENQSNPIPGGTAISGSSHNVSVPRLGSATSAVTSGNQASRQQQKQHLKSLSDFIENETSHESFTKMLTKFEATFDAQLKDFLDKLWADSFRHHPQLSNLCVRLDYNGFYSGRFSGGNDESSFAKMDASRLSNSIAGASINISVTGGSGYTRSGRSGI